jgi:putative membrane protein
MKKDFTSLSKGTRISLRIIFLTLLALFIAGCNAKEEPAVEKGAAINAQDSAFLQFSAQMNRAEIELNEMALTKGKDSSIVKYAERMLTEHKEALNELDSLARGKAIVLNQASDSEQMRIKESLSKLIGLAFDTMFIDVQRRNHEKGIAAYRAELDNGANLEIRNYATKYLDALQLHMQHARAFDSMGTYR